MRSLRATALAALACVVITPLALAQPWGADRAISLVLAEDPRFADALDYEFQEMWGRANFDTIGSVLSVDYYRALPTQASYWSPWYLDLDYPGSWLVEVVLVRGCVEPSSDVGPLPDPCSWRHAWYYRVEPDDTVTLLFEEGHPDPPPSSAQ